MDVDLSIPRIVHAIRFSIGAPNVSLKSELGGGTVIEENSSKGRETVSEMVGRTGGLLAINGDFFPFTGDPLGVMVRDGQLISTPSLARAVFGWGPKSSALGLIEFRGTTEIGGQTYELKGINQECPLNEMVLNTEIAAFAMAKTPCVHAVIKMDEADWSPNGTFTGTFDAYYVDAPKLPLQHGNAILTAQGSKGELLKTLVPGQKISFKFETIGFDWSKIDQSIGGGPFLLRNSQVAVDAERQGFNDAFTNKRHPRTAIGRTADGDLWIAVIDGRQKVSDGATLEEAAKVMLRLGCVDAINLDGGGSSSINVLGLLLNRPSDGVERPVANGLVVMGAKSDPSAVPLKIRVPEKLVLGQAKTLTVVDEKGNLIPNVEVFWSSSGDAWVDQGGLARPIAKGKVEIGALARGQLLRATLAVEEPPKIVPPKKPKPKPKAKKKRRRG
jgi:hypothetical protein